VLQSLTFYLRNPTEEFVAGPDTKSPWPHLCGDGPLPGARPRNV